MLLQWFNTREVTELGAALADDFVLQTAQGSPAQRQSKANPAAQGKELQKVLNKFLQRVDREARPLKLNAFKKAKLANSFKWRLLEKGVEPQIVDELTRALVMRLSAKPSSDAAASASQPAGRDATSLGARGTHHFHKRQSPVQLWQSPRRKLPCRKPDRYGRHALRYDGSRRRVCLRCGLRVDAVAPLHPRWPALRCAA